MGISASSRSGRDYCQVQSKSAGTPVLPRFGRTSAQEKAPASREDGAFRQSRESDQFGGFAGAGAGAAGFGGGGAGAADGASLITSSVVTTGFGGLGAEGWRAAGLGASVGAGGFGMKADFPTGSYPAWLAVADMSGDGIPDVAVVNSNSNTVSILLGLGGSIVPAGVTTLASSASQTYTITPAAGYGILNVLVDGVSQGAVGSYAFTNVTANHRIDASFGRTQVGVPQEAPLTFSLEGAPINPSSGVGMKVVFSQPAAAKAQLELLDIAGRRLAVREVGSLGAGRHTVDMAEGRKMTSGVYWVRLIHGQDKNVVKVVVIR